MHNPTQTLLMTTTISIRTEHQQAEFQIARHCVQKVHWGVHFRFSLVLDGAPIMMCHHCHVHDPPQVCLQAFVEMSLSAIRKSDIPPKYWVAIYCIFAEKRCCNFLCIPSLMKHMVAGIIEPSRIQKHPVDCISAPGSSVLHFFSQSTCDQSGVQCPFLCKPDNSDWQLSITTTSISSNALKSVWAGVSCCVELLRLQSGLYSSYFLQQKSMALQDPIPSQYYPLDLQVHLITATSSENTSQRVNAISV